MNKERGGVGACPFLRKYFCEWVLNLFGIPGKAVGLAKSTPVRKPPPCPYTVLGAVQAYGCPCTMGRAHHPPNIHWREGVLIGQPCLDEAWKGTEGEM